MKRIREQAEVIVRLDFQDQLAHICVSAWPRMAAKAFNLYGISKDGRNTSKSARWTVPLRCVSFRSLMPSKRAIPASRRAYRRDPEGQLAKVGG
jgi:hypothetical protein